MAMKTVRSVDVFYEKTGPRAVARDRAEYVFATAFDILGRHTGRIVVNSVRGVKLPLQPERPVRYSTLKLGDSRHAAFISRRLVDSRDIVDAVAPLLPGAGGCPVVDGKLTSKLLISDEDPLIDITAGVSISTAVHEGAHTYGLLHCGNRSCIMQAVLHVNMDRPGDILTTGDPFCGQCAEGLENAPAVFYNMG